MESFTEELESIEAIRSIFQGQRKEARQGPKIPLVFFGFSCQLRFPGHVQVILTFSVDIEAGQSGTNIPRSFLHIPPWMTEHEAGLLAGGMTVTEIDPRSPEAFDGRKNGATTMTAAMIAS